eukprot:TRINITY_DN45133_c0_g1_i1.p1 TRINITY_DN45133_c0_g1~~TRINITY_DN45133_c0_g1_i1.p1  ORF type:complete len:114 (-),score=15.94 TRINITY_DN45133_c0_g1_i1:139-444(-)
MLRSLVGSEMCIRDSRPTSRTLLGHPWQPLWHTLAPGRPLLWPGSWEHAPSLAPQDLHLSGCSVDRTLIPHGARQNPGRQPVALASEPPHIPGTISGTNHA